MNKKIEEEVARIEQAQDVLRDSIAKTKALSDRAETLLQQNKRMRAGEPASD